MDAPVKTPTPANSEKAKALQVALAQIEKQYLLAALRSAEGIRTRAADLLRMSHRSFRHYAKKYNI